MPDRLKLQVLKTRGRELWERCEENLWNETQETTNPEAIFSRTYVTEFELKLKVRVWRIDTRGSPETGIQVTHVCTGRPSAASGSGKLDVAEEQGQMLPQPDNHIPSEHNYLTHWSLSPSSISSSLSGIPSELHGRTMWKRLKAPSRTSVMEILNNF